MGRDPGIAPVLSVFLWGLGFLYLGQFEPWIGWLILQIACGAGLILTWDSGWSVWISVATIILWLLQVWKALQAAEREAQRRDLQQDRKWEAFWRSAK